MRIASWTLLTFALLVQGCGRLGYEDQGAASDDAGANGTMDAGDAAVVDGGDGGTNALTLADACGFVGGLVVQDGIATDDAAGAAIAASIATACGPFAITSASQDVAGVLEPGTGRPIGGPGALYVAGGGEDNQRSVAYLQMARTPVAVSRSGTSYILTNRATGQVIRDVDVTTLGAGHDIAIIQIAREPSSGTVELIVYGYYAGGTEAGVYFFENQLAPTLTSNPYSFYVLEWTDGNGDSTPNAGDTYDVVGSGA